MFDGNVLILTMEGATDTTGAEEKEHADTAGDNEQDFHANLTFVVRLSIA